jgi:hypothetical protein
MQMASRWTQPLDACHCQVRLALGPSGVRDLPARSPARAPDRDGSVKSAAVSYVESHATQGRKEFLFDHLFQMIDTVGSPLKLTTGTFMVSRPQHVEAVAHSGDGWFNRPACIERFPQFVRGATHVAVGVGQEFQCQTLDTFQHRIDSRKVPVHVTPALDCNSERAALPLQN